MPRGMVGFTPTIIFYTKRIVHHNSLLSSVVSILQTSKTITTACIGSCASEIPLSSNLGSQGSNTLTMVSIKTNTPPGSGPASNDHFVPMIG